MGRIFQASWDVESEVEGETGIKGPQRCEPFHGGALCIQGKAGIEDREGISDEEVEGGDQLSKWIRCWSCVHIEVAVGGLTETPGRLYFFALAPPQTATPQTYR